jgi:hypothetical protein
LGKASADVSHLGIIIVVVYANFSMGGCALFGAELREWSDLRRAARATLGVLVGTEDFGAMFDVAPVSATLWFFSFTISLLFVLSNLLVGILVDHHGSVERTGEDEMGVPKQLQSLFSDWYWTNSYQYRTVYRFVQKRLPKKPKKRTLMSLIVRFMTPKKDESRVPKVPYEQLMNVLDPIPPPKPEDDDEPYDWEPPCMWEQIGADLLLENGCDEATAARLLMKCAKYAKSHAPETYPPDQLFDEVVATMQTAYDCIDEGTQELYSWISERIIDCNHIEPRQRKLEEISKVIEAREDTSEEESEQWDGKHDPDDDMNVDSPEMRIAEDGVAYTFEQFVEFFGGVEAGQEAWDYAIKVESVAIAE